MCIMPFRHTLDTLCLEWMFWYDYHSIWAREWSPARQSDLFKVKTAVQWFSWRKEMGDDSRFQLFLDEGRVPIIHVEEESTSSWERSLGRLIGILMQLELEMRWKIISNRRVSKLDSVWDGNFYSLPSHCRLLWSHLSLHLIEAQKKNHARVTFEVKCDVSESLKSIFESNSRYISNQTPLNTYDS